MAGIRVDNNSSSKFLHHSSKSLGTVGTQAKQIVQANLPSVVVSGRPEIITKEFVLHTLENRCKLDNISFEDILSYTSTTEDLFFLRDTVEGWSDKIANTETGVDKKLEKFVRQCLNNVDAKINSTITKKSGMEQASPDGTSKQKEFSPKSLDGQLNRASTSSTPLVPSNPTQIRILKDCHILFMHKSLHSIINHAESAENKTLWAALAKARHMNHPRPINQQLKSLSVIIDKSSLAEQFSDRTPSSSSNLRLATGSASMTSLLDRGSGSQNSVGAADKQLGARDDTSATAATIADETPVQHPEESAAAPVETPVNSPQPDEFAPANPHEVLSGDQSSSTPLSFTENRPAAEKLQKTKLEELEKSTKKGEQKNPALQSLINSLEELFEVEEDNLADTATTSKRRKHGLTVAERLKALNSSIRNFIQRELASKQPCLAQKRIAERLREMESIQARLAQQSQAVGVDQALRWLGDALEEARVAEKEAAEKCRLSREFQFSGLGSQ